MHGGPQFFPDGIFSLVNKLPGLGGAGSNDGVSQIITLDDIFLHFYKCNIDRP